MYRNLFSALKLEKFAMFIILTFIVLVAAFNIIISLIMLVMEKSRDIAILKALGATSERIMRIFIVQGMVVGVVGTSLGGCRRNCRVPRLLARYPIIELPAEIYTISTLPVAVEPSDVLDHMCGGPDHLFPGHALPVVASGPPGACGGPPV